MRKLTGILLMLALASTANNTHATLIGDEISVAWDNSSVGIIESHTVTVGEGADLNFISIFGTDNFQLDVDESNILVTYIGIGGIEFGAVLDQFIFSDLDWVGSPNSIISGLSLESFGIGGLSASFMDNSVFLNLSGSSWSPGNSVLLSLETSSAISEPSTLLLTGIGLIVISGFNHRRRTKPSRNVA